MFLPTVAAATLIPTAAECAARSDLSPLLEAVKGFSFTNKAIPIPNLASPFTGEIPGEDTAPQSTLTFYRQDTPNTLRTTLAKGTVGFIVVAHYKIEDARRSGHCRHLAGHQRWDPPTSSTSRTTPRSGTASSTTPPRRNSTER